VLAYLRKGETFAELAAGFGIGTATAWRYVKSWRIWRKLRCCPWRAGQLAKAIHVLQTRDIGG
jgi:hypothetical protein